MSGNFNFNLSVSDETLIQKLENSEIKSKIFEKNMGIHSFLNNIKYKDVTNFTSHFDIYKWSFDSNKMSFAICNDSTIKMNTIDLDNGILYTYGPEDFIKFVMTNEQVRNRFYLPIEIHSHKHCNKIRPNLLLIFNSIKYDMLDSYTKIDNSIVMIQKRNDYSKENFDLLNRIMLGFLKYNDKIGYRFKDLSICKYIHPHFFNDIWWSIYIITYKSAIHDKYIKFLILGENLYKLSGDEICDIHNEIAEMKLNFINNVPHQFVSYCDMVKFRNQLYSIKQNLVSNGNCDDIIFEHIINDCEANIKKITSKWTDNFGDDLGPN